MFLCLCLHVNSRFTTVSTPFITLPTVDLPVFPFSSPLYGRARLQRRCICFPPALPMSPYVCLIFSAHISLVYSFPRASCNKFPDVSCLINHTVRMPRAMIIMCCLTSFVGAVRVSSVITASAWPVHQHLYHSITPIRGLDRRTGQAHPAHPVLRDSTCRFPHAVDMRGISGVVGWKRKGFRDPGA